MKNTKGRYPTTTQSFEVIRHGKAIYIDKTSFIMPLLSSIYESCFFLSRPRRFGKSLFLDTLEQFFLGKKELFEGLYIYDKVSWESYPVIRLSLDGIGFFGRDLEEALYEYLLNQARKYLIELTAKNSPTAFAELIEKLYALTGKQVVILIDEYDKPIIQYLESSEIATAELNRDILKSFYGVLKSSGKYLRFTFITGVSKIARVSIFSDLNHLHDLTLDPDFATICGFTKEEILTYCKEGIEELAKIEGKTQDAILEKIKFWYDGFSWNAIDFVYNPFSFMRLLSNMRFENYWFESGTPTFLVRLVKQKKEFMLNNIKVSKYLYNWYDFKNLDYISIMLQTGYLTFKKHIADDLYIVGFPNKEVEMAFSQMLLEDYLHLPMQHAAVTIYDIQQSLIEDDIEKMILIIGNMFKTLPHQFFTESYEVKDKNGTVKTVEKAVGESFYHAVIYLIFNILGVKMNVEVSSQEGRIDAVVETQSHIYLFEFKKNRKAEIAIQQIQQHKYAYRFTLSKKKIKLVGLTFSLQKKGISDYKILEYVTPQ